MLLMIMMNKNVYLFSMLSNFVLKGTVFFKLFGFNRRPKLF